MRSLLQRVGDASGTVVVTALTNRRDTRSEVATRWGKLAHACGLVGIALMLERRWSRVLIASTYGYANMFPWGSHPVTDPLLSTARTRVVHDGAEVNRVEKTRIVAQSPIARQYLRVCWRSASDTNCGACEKCYRTMTTLWLLGYLEQFSSFPTEAFRPELIDRIFCRNQGAFLFTRENRQLAIANGRSDVRRSIDRALARSRRLTRIQSVFRDVKTRFEPYRLLYRPLKWVLDRIEWRLLRNTIS